MIVIPNEPMHRVELGDGRAVYVREQEMNEAIAEGGTLIRALERRANEQLADEAEAMRRAAAAKMALTGEWGALARLLKMLGVEPTR